MKVYNFTNCKVKNERYNAIRGEFINKKYGVCDAYYKTYAKHTLLVSFQLSVKRQRLLLITLYYLLFTNY